MIVVEVATRHEAKMATRGESTGSPDATDMRPLAYASPKVGRNDQAIIVTPTSSQNEIKEDEENSNTHHTKSLKLL